MASSKQVSRLRWLARKVARPVTSPIDGRVADINRRVADIDRRVADANHRVHIESDILRGRIDQLERALVMQIGSYAQASTEATSYVGVELRQLAETVSELSTDAQEERYRERLARARDAPLEELDGDLASLLNHAAGHEGFAAQAELWFNPPVTVELSEKRARLAAVNERIVEVPFAMAALGRIPPPARVLDVGSAESTFPLSAASLGYEVTAVDPRPLPYSHPNLQSVATRFEDWHAPTEPFAAIFLISTIEHVGLPAYSTQSYGGTEPGAGADRELLEHARGLLADDGLLVVTTPYGDRGVDDFQRTYDDESLATLFDGWHVRERRVVKQRDDLVWTPEADEQPGHAGVVMVLATPTQAP